MTETELNSENYQKDKISMSMAKASIAGALLAIPIIVLLHAIYSLMWRESQRDGIIDTFFFANFLPLFIALCILGAIAHELIHGAVAAKYAKNGFKSVKFGVEWKYLMPYCHCTEPMQVKHYNLVLIMPVLLAIIPYTISLITGSYAFLILGIVFAIGSIGDFVMLYLLQKENKNDWVQDLPDEVGCAIYRAK